MKLLADLERPGLFLNRDFRLAHPQVLLPERMLRLLRWQHAVADRRKAGLAVH